MTLALRAADFAAPGDAWPRPHDNCYWLLPGRLLAGEHPGAADAAVQARRMLALLDAGVACVIDLTEAGEGLPGYAAALRAAAASRRVAVSIEAFPIADYSVPEPATMRRILDAIALALRCGQTLYLHCHGGAGRTGTVVGCLLVEYGHTPAQALQLIARKWQVVAKRVHVPASPETPAQREFIQRWPQAPRP